jgi:hypothetical protein
VRTYHYFSGLGDVAATVTKPTSTVQRALYERGFDPGPIDNKYGERTYTALSRAVDRILPTAPDAAILTDPTSRAPYPTTITVTRAAWDAIRALPITRRVAAGTTSAPPVPTSGADTTPSATPGATSSGTSIGPGLDPLATFTANGGGDDSSGKINWGLVLGAGAIAFGVGWFFLNKRGRGVSGLGRARRRRRRSR